MRRTQLVSILSLLSFVATPALAYYQDKFNPNSSTFDPQNTGYYQNIKHHRSEPNPRMGQNPSAVYSSRSYDYASEREPTGKPVFIYDPSKLTWAAYDGGGQLVKTGPGSAGSNYCPDLGRPCHTPTGTFHIFAKEGEGYRSKIFPLPYGGAPMPYAMFFHGGLAVHGSYEVMNFNASHGCIRILPQDAEWLSRNVLTYGSTVIVKPYSF